MNEEIYTDREGGEVLIDTSKEGCDIFKVEHGKKFIDINTFKLGTIIGTGIFVCTCGNCGIKQYDPVLWVKLDKDNGKVSMYSGGNLKEMKLELIKIPVQSKKTQRH